MKHFLPGTPDVVPSDFDRSVLSARACVRGPARAAPAGLESAARGGTRSEKKNSEKKTKKARGTMGEA
ncbi:hypothetical protein, partial [Actinoplanes sp. NPDC049802]|uniref:hypothetical protein n=1 Tax=Actinoplanes sp. NPDC049802 TaxID=3154742 RepID=UPI0033DA99F2